MELLMCVNVLITSPRFVPLIFSGTELSNPRWPSLRTAITTSTSPLHCLKTTQNGLCDAPRGIGASHSLPSLTTADRQFNRFCDQFQ